jgi:hypothetical protein
MAIGEKGTAIEMSNVVVTGRYQKYTLGAE